MGFRIMHHDSVAGAAEPCIFQVSFDLFAGIVLEQFGVCPVHIRLVKQIRRHSRIAAEAFQQENRFREFVTDTGCDVFPRGFGNHIPRVTAEAVHAAHTPCAEHRCKIFP